MAFTFNGATKIITLSAGTTLISVRDLWTAWVDWLGLSDNSKYPEAMTSLGGDEVGGGIFVPVYCFLQNGWKIRPQEANHTLGVNDGIIIGSGGGDPFTDTLGNYRVNTRYSQPVQAISYDAAGGSTGPTPEQVANAVWAAEPEDDPFPTAVEISNEVWSNKPADPVIPTPPTTQQIADAVWEYSG
ncbi:MAG: hypothetical protein IPN62_16450 [Flavobacteriales bacterium]|nr:hypothetical protein [Flavobacteriales bacterium]